MKTKRTINKSIIYLLTSFIALISTTYKSYAGEFYVIPVVTEVEVVKEVEICYGGTPVGAEVFKLDNVAGSVGLHLGDIYATNTGRLVKIVGLDRDPND